MTATNKTLEDQLDAMVDKYFPKLKRHARGQAILMMPEIRELVEAHYIPKEEVARAIGEDEDTAQALNTKDDSWSVSRIVERNQFRAEIRKALKLDDKT